MRSGGSFFISFEKSDPAFGIAFLSNGKKRAELRTAPRAYMRKTNLCLY